MGSLAHLYVTLIGFLIERSYRYIALINGCDVSLTILVQSWACFEPPKTTIKRMLLKEPQKPNWNGSFSSMNTEKVETSMLKESVSHQTDARTSSIVFPAFKMEG